MGKTENSGIGLSYENAKNNLPKAEFEKRAEENKKYDLDIEKYTKIDALGKMKMDAEMQQNDVKKNIEKSKEAAPFKKEIEALRSDILADLNNDGIGGTEVKNDRKYEKIRGKQEKIEQSQKDILDTLHYTVDVKDAPLVENFVTKGVLTGINFKKGLADMYRATAYPDYENKSKEEKKIIRESVSIWINNIEQQTSEKIMDNGNTLWDELHYVNRIEKNQDRKERRAQKKTEYNQAEITFTEEQLKDMLDNTSKEMGKDAFAEALYKKLVSIRPDALKGIRWNNMDGLNQILTLPTYSSKRDAIRSIMKDNLSVLTTTSMRQWLTIEKTPKTNEDINKYAKEIEAKCSAQLDVKIKKAFESLPTDLTIDPARTQEVQRLLRSQISMGVAAGYAKVIDQPTGTKIEQAGAGMALNFDLKRATVLIDNMTLAIGANQNGELGVAVKFDKNIVAWNTGAVKGTVGAINFIPFARLGVSQTLNQKAIQENIKSKRIVQVGAYAQAMPGIATTGIEFSTNLEGGINKARSYLEQGVLNALPNITKGMNVDQTVAELQKEFTKAKAESLKPLAQAILDRVNQSISSKEIASQVVTDLTNGKIRVDLPNKVDVSLQAGVGAVGIVPIAEFFAGIKIYGKAATMEDKFDKQGKEDQLSSLKVFHKFENPDVNKMSMSEKIQYWMGSEVTVTETEKLISISTKDVKRPIYDQFDIFVKGSVADGKNNIVEVDDSHIILSKGSNLMMGKLTGAYKEKQKLYIGYDQNKDGAELKHALNAPLSGHPETVPYNNKLKVESQDILFSNIDKKDIYAEYFNKAKAKCIEATNKVQKEKYAYNGYCADLITEITNYSRTGKNTEAAWNDLLGSFNQLMKRVGADQLTTKKEDSRSQLVNQMLNTIAYSIKAWNLNVANPNVGKEKPAKGTLLPKNITELINRKGAISAFKNGGFDLADNTFDTLHDTVKNETLYKQVRYPNAIAVVAYYRNIGPKQPMNMTALTGFDGVTLAHSSKNSEIFKDNVVDAKTQQKIIETLLANPQEFAAYKERIITMLKDKKIDTSAMNDEMYIKLINGEKVNGITLNKTFFKAFNGPCVNEALVMNLLGIHVETYELPKEGDVLVGALNTENYQRTHSTNIGVGGAYGQRLFKNGEGKSVPGAGTGAGDHGSGPGGNEGGGDPGNGSHTGD